MLQKLTPALEYLIFTVDGKRIVPHRGPDERELTAMLAGLALRAKACFLQDVARTVVNADSAISGWLGLSPLDMALTPRFSMGSYIDPEDLPLVQNALETAISAHSVFQIVYRVKSKNGQTRWLLEEGTPRIASMDSPCMVESLLTDITDRKALIDDYKRQKSFFESTLSSLPLEVVVVDKEQRYCYLNAAAESNEDRRAYLIGRDDFQESTDAGLSISQAIKRREAFLQVLRTGIAVEWEEKPDTNPDGDVRHMLRKYSLIASESGEPKLVVGYGIDITHTRKVEESSQLNGTLLNSVTENVQAGVFRFARSGSLVYANQAFLQLFGKAEVEALANPEPLFFVREMEARMELILEIEEQGEVREREVCIHVGERIIWTLLSCRRTELPDTTVYYDGVLTDFTERKAQDELLKSSNRELEKANSELDRFVYSASHDLRAPLTSIMGILKLAELESPESHLNNYFRMIKDSVTKLDSFVKDIINYYRNTRGEITSGRVEFMELVNESFSHLRYVNGAPAVRLRTDIDDRIPFYTDVQRLTVVINNLLSNALKYHNTEQRDPYVAVHVTTTEDAAIIAIEDNGTGIEDKHHPLLFNMFYRATGSDTGTGLGLYIVKEAVERLGGTVGVRSKIGVGTTFTLTLPNKPVYEEV